MAVISEFHKVERYPNAFTYPALIPYLENLSDGLRVERPTEHPRVEFKNTHIYQSGFTFGSSPFAVTPNLSLTTIATNPGANYNYTMPRIIGKIPISILISLANTNRSYVIFALPFKSLLSNKNVYFVASIGNIVYDDSRSRVTCDVKLQWIYDGYNPDTAPAGYIYWESSYNNIYSSVFTSACMLITFECLEAENALDQFATLTDFIPEVLPTLDLNVWGFSFAYADAFSDLDILPGIGDTVTQLISNDSNRKIQAIRIPNASNNSNLRVQWCAPAYLQKQLSAPGSMITETWSEEFGKAAEGGGYNDGAFTYEDDEIVIPETPTLGVSTAGLINIYKVSLNDLQGLGSYIFPAPTYNPPSPVSGSDTTQVLINGFNSLMTELANIPSAVNHEARAKLIDYVVDVHIIPCTPSTSGSGAIKVGWENVPDTNVAKVSSDYKTVDCGSIAIREFYASFADYLTSARLFLPFVGFVPVHPEWFQNGSLNVKYRFNIIDGSFTCWVISYADHVGQGRKGGIVGQYGGSCCVHIPITGANYANMMSGAIGATTGLAAAAATGNVAMAATSALAAVSAKPSIAQSNSYSASAAFLGIRKPFLMVARPTSQYAENYQHEVGIPAKIYARLGNLSGFVQMTDVHLEGLRGTLREKKLIEQYLAEGIVVS